MPEPVTSPAQIAVFVQLKRWACWESLALLIPLAIFLLLASHSMHAPGLYYDEMFVISPATGIPAYKTWFGLPIMISPYVGADKAWIYPPIFWLFGVSAWSIRLPAILISCASLILGYFLVRRILTPAWALIFTTACAVHPGFIFLTKVDWGPVVLMLFLKALSLVIWFRWLDGTQKTCWLLFPLWVLGFWDKFNFVWFIIALVLATAVVYRAVIWQKILSLRPGLLVTAVIGLIGAGLLTLWIIFPLLQKPSTSAFSDRFLHVWALYKYTCTGLGTASMWFKSVPAMPAWTGWGVPVLTLAFLVLALSGYALSDHPTPAIDRRVLRFCLWCLLMFGIIFLEVAVTPQAGGAHHTIMLFPFDLLACLSAAYLLGNALVGKKRALILILQSGIFLFWAACNLESIRIHFNKFKDISSFRARFSPRIESLADYLNSQGQELKAIHCVDWGIGMQLAAICRPAVRSKVIDEWMTFKSWSPKEAGSQATVDSIFSPDKKSIYLSFTAKEPVFPETKSNFAEMEMLAGARLHPVKFVPATLGETYVGLSNYNSSPQVSN